MAQIARTLGVGRSTLYEHLDLSHESSTEHDLAAQPEQRLAGQRVVPRPQIDGQGRSQTPCPQRVSDTPDLDHESA